MSISREQAEHLIKLLEQVHERPTAYLGPELNGVVHFLWGVRSVCFAVFKLSMDDGVYKQVIEERGWNYSAVAPLIEIKERGLSDLEMAKELLIIEIAVWKRQFGITE